MKAALLGLTHPHTEVLLTTLVNLPEITAVSLWDADPAIVVLTELRRRPKVTFAGTDLDRILAQPDLDFAIVCVRADQAAEIASRVVAAGKHLVAEKPVGLHAADIAALASAAARAGVVASVLYVRRAPPCALAARRSVESGALGPFLSLESRFLTTQVRYRQPDSWLFRREQSGGGILTWLGCHCLDLLHFITGDEIAEVSAQLAIRGGKEIDVEDTAALALRFRSGAIGTFHAGYTLAHRGAGYVNRAGNDSYLAINGRSGRVVWPDLEPRLCFELQPVADESPRHEETYDFPPSSSYSGASGDTFFRQYLAAIRGAGPPPTTLADAVRTAQVIAAARLSADTGQTVRLP